MANYSSRCSRPCRNALFYNQRDYALGQKYMNFSKHKLVKYIKEVLLFIVLMAIFANILSLYRSGSLNKEPLNIKAITLLDGSIYEPPNNKPILLHFWASWCPTCKAEAQNIETISKNFHVLTIALKSGSNEEIKEYLQSRNLSFKTVNDNSGKITQKYSVSVFPTTIIYDKDGNELFSEVGYTTTIGLWLRMWIAGL